MWVATESKSGIGATRTVFAPLARLKDENGKLRVPDSNSHILQAPAVDNGDRTSEKCD